MVAISWDIKTGRCLTTFKGHTDRVSSVAFADGMLFSGSHDNTVKVWDFTASHITIFEELAELLEKNSQEALARFIRMPKNVKNAIYGKLYEICKPFVNDYRGVAKHAFHSQKRQSATSAQKALAIRNYLNDQPPQKLSSLLAHLGIHIEKDYLEKLKCRSGHLQKIGILSPKDLNVICSTSNLSELTIHEIVDVEWDFRDNKVKLEARNRKINLETLMEELSKGVESKIQETNTCGVLLYDAECPWISFQKKLKAFQTKFTEIAEKADTAKSMAEAFNRENYQNLANELNTFVQEFQALDRDHQIAKLHAYVNQWGILKAWDTTLRSQGVLNLSALPEPKPSLQELLQMGLQMGE